MQQDRPGDGHRWVVLGVCCLSILVVGLDNTVVNLALPAIQRDLHATTSRLQWTIDAYQLVLGALLLLAGSSADRFGRRRTFQLGMAVFTVASALCGLAPGVGWLIAFRVLQAVGGSMLNPVAMSIVRHAFTDPGERARAFGIWSAVYGLSMALGPVLGGTLVGSAGWRSIFWINVPVGLVAIVLMARHVTESSAPRPRRFDPVGQVLVIVMLACLTYGIIEGPSAGWASAPIIGCFVVSGVALLGLLGYEPRRADPLVDLAFFRSVPFSGATAIALCALAATGGFLFVNTLYLQDVRGFSPLRSGLCLLPVALMTLAFAPVSGRLTARRGTRTPLLIAGASIAVSGVMLTFLTRGTALPVLLTAYAVFGLGFGMANAPVTATAVSGMPAAQAGVASAIASTGRQVGQGLGVAIVPAVIASGLHGPLADGLPAASHAGWWVIVGCGVAVSVLAVLTTSAWAKGTAAAAAARFAAEPDPDTAEVPTPRPTNSQPCR